MAGSYARRYAEQNGAAIMLTSLDREAEFRSDEAAEFYLARAGLNPLALYAVLQKLTALGSESASLAQLYKSHPPLDARIDRIDQRGYGALETLHDAGLNDPAAGIAVPVCWTCGRAGRLLDLLLARSVHQVEHRAEQRDPAVSRNGATKVPVRSTSQPVTYTPTMPGSVATVLLSPQMTSA